MSRALCSDDPLKPVIDNGYCIGCGACAAIDPSIRIKLDSFGCYVAEVDPESKAIQPSAAKVCPFADGTPDEDSLAGELFGSTNTYHPLAGFHMATYAGWVQEQNLRADGSSGGLASWLLVELLKRRLVDHVVHVGPALNPDSGASPLFHYSISSTEAEVLSKSKSRYYPVEMSQVIERMLAEPGRYVVVGIPCFIKAIRLLCNERPLLRQRVSFTVGIVCGHLKSSAFAELLAWQCGIRPDELRNIDFRQKLPSGPASSYAVTVDGEHNGNTVRVTRPTSELFGTNWGQGLFKYKACDFCDDVFAETADVVLGDAWLPEYESDGRGTNVAIVRHTVFKELLEHGSLSGNLHLHQIPVSKIVESQLGGLRHRRGGLAYRLELEDEAGRWRPRKRVRPDSSHLSNKQREIYKLRYEISQTSHEAFAKAKSKMELPYFVLLMRPLIDKYDKHYKRSFLSRAVNKIKGMLARRLFNYFRQSDF